MTSKFINLLIITLLLAFINSTKLRSISKLKAHDSNYKNLLIAGETLFGNRNEMLVSPSGEFKLVMQSDGNLVLSNVKNDITIWSSGTASNKNLPYSCTMQGDGNLVIYNKKTQPVWSSLSFDWRPSDIYALILEDSGKLTIYGINQSLKWMARGRKIIK